MNWITEAREAHEGILANRDQYLLRSLVTAQRERKMAMKTRDQGLIKSAETRLSVAWKNACDHVDATTRAALGVKEDQRG